MTPILYSFRRCPYAMRARLAIASAGVRVELREVVLRDKPGPMLAASPKGTVPVLVTGAGVIDESLDVMLWALGRSDPEGWLNMPQTGHALISQADGPFKTALDRYKYHTRYKGADPHAERAAATAFLQQIDAQISGKRWLFSDRPSLADMAILPFVRQFAMVDKPWFDTLPLPAMRDWLERFLVSRRFASVMAKYPKWTGADAPVHFPEHEVAHAP